MRVLTLLLLTGCANADAVMDATETADIVFEVPAGASGNKIGALLQADGIISSTWNWKLVLREVDGDCMKAGRHTVRKSMSVTELVAALCAAPIADDEPFAVLEGWRIKDIDEALAAKGWISPGEYTKLATDKSVDIPFEISSPTLEGYLYPETYLVLPGKDSFSAQRLIERQLETFQTRFLVPNQDKLGERTLHDVVVVASMIEREEPTDKHRPTVAGIIYKRLDSNTPLGIDATSRYQLKRFNDEKGFRAVLKDPNDLYGTRMRAGLPPTAIGNPTQSALEAAINPAETEFWYYLHDSKGVFHGGRNGAEHEANRAKYGVY